MKLHQMHPRDQLVAIMDRIYRGEMTTLSGGNLSIKDSDGDIWITPAGTDKGQMVAADICRVDERGQSTGLHRPSSELPFHQAIYEARPDIRAIAHAHPPALVAFSIARVVPDTSLLPFTATLFGSIGYAPYALTGSEALGRSIAGEFAAGHDIVILENHGAVAAGESLFEAFRRLEALDFCARILISARAAGPRRRPIKTIGPMSNWPPVGLPEFEPADSSKSEQAGRSALAGIARRAYVRKLMLSTQGDISVRIDASEFLITPPDEDRAALAPDDLVLVSNGRRETGKLPGHTVALHQAIYDRHPEIQAVILAHPPHATAYAIVDARFDTRTIPESFIMLREIPRLPQAEGNLLIESVASIVSTKTPVVLLEHEGVLVTGKDLLQALDRLEVAEYSARSLIHTTSIGPLQPIGAHELQELRTEFDL